MIQLIQAPDKNRVIADGNETLIKVKSTLDSSYFIRAIIKINDVHFIDQSWSKDHNGNCTFNLKHLYYDYFESVFSSEITSGLQTKSGLFKKVSIELQEIKVGTIAPSYTLELSDFYILKNNKPFHFDDTKTVTFLGLESIELYASRDKGVIFPVYLSGGASVTVKINDLLGNVLFSEVLNAPDKQVASYGISFEDHDFSQHEAVNVVFQTAQDQAQRRIRFINDSIYQVKQIWYLNNCGLYLPAFLTGKMIYDHSLDPKSYFQNDGTEVTYDVADNKQIDLYSGYGRQDFTYIIHAIATSIDVRLFLDGFWERVKSETKQVPKYEDNKFIYSERLSFSRINVANFGNENTFIYVPTVDDITINGQQDSEVFIPKQRFLDAYTGTKSATRLILSSLPDNAKLVLQTQSGNIALSDLVDNDPSQLPYELPLVEFQGMYYQPIDLGYGEPLDIFQFKMGSDVLISDSANIIANIKELPDNLKPPIIIVNTLFTVNVNNSGDGSAEINCTVTNPNGNSNTILWEPVDGAPISFSENSIANPDVTFDNADLGEDYQIRITATDNVTAVSATKLITVRAKLSQLGIRIENQVVSRGLQKDADLVLYNGGAGKGVTLQMRSYIYNEAVQGVYLYYGTGQEENIVGQKYKTIYLDENGSFRIPVTIFTNHPSAATLSVNIFSSQSSIDEENDQVSIGHQYFQSIVF